jgi:hypothetical protein
MIKNQYAQASSLDHSHAEGARAHPRCGATILQVWHALMQFLHWIMRPIGSTSRGNQTEEFFMHLARFRRVFLAHLATPLEPMERLSKELGVEIWIKRDDCNCLE